MYQPINLRKKKSEVLVVHCSDPRFQTAYRKFIDNLGAYYDLLVIPGASKAVSENPSVMDKIVLLHGLHHFEAVHILDHVQCAAFGEIQDEVKAHLEMMAKATAALEEAIFGIKVNRHLLGDKAELKLPSS